MRGRIKPRFDPAAQVAAFGADSLLPPGYKETPPRHRWSEPLRQSSELTIRTCQKCGLVWWSRHAWGGVGSYRSDAHWSEFYAESNSEFRLTRRPKCREDQT
jgi:hypothetical protein